MAVPPRDWRQRPPHRAGRQPSGGRLRVRQVRADHVKHQRHDLRAWPHSAEADWRPASPAAWYRYADLNRLRWCCWWDSVSEDESPIVFLRLRKAADTASRCTRSPPLVACTKCRAVAKTVPGGEPAALDDLATGAVGDLLATPGRGHHGRGSAWPRYRADCRRPLGH